MVLKAHPTDPDKLIFDNKDRIELLNALTAPPQREWQGLTNEEIEDIRLEYHYADGAVKVGYERAIEAKLREKNSD